MERGREKHSRKSMRISKSVQQRRKRERDEPKDRERKRNTKEKERERRRKKQTQKHSPDKQLISCVTMDAHTYSIPFLPHPSLHQAFSNLQ